LGALCIEFRILSGKNSLDVSSSRPINIGGYVDLADKYFFTRAKPALSTDTETKEPSHQIDSRPEGCVAIFAGGLFMALGLAILLLQRVIS
jgi:hypothetical protein